MELREHQTRAIEMCNASIDKGNKRIMLAAPCSFGKTRVAVEMLANAAKQGKEGIFICDRIKLVQQTIDEFDKHGIEAGVIQGWDHPRANWHSPIQIASIQTLARRRNWPMSRLIIIDEAHVHYKTTSILMDKYKLVPIIGLSATPFSKGLGNHYQDLIVPITSRQLMDRGFLAPVKYFAGKKPSLKGVKTKRLQSGASDYDPNSLAERMEEDTNLVGDIIKNWLKHGENSQTIAFSPSINHSKTMVKMFNEAGIPAEHIDGYMPDEERQILYREHDEGKFKILSCSKLLNTGYDAPSVRCLIDAYPTKSLASYVQRIGRVLRLHEDKPYAIVLDHASNVSKLGFAEDVVPDALHKGEKVYTEKDQTTERDKKDPSTMDCPQCHQVMKIPRCPCGYELPPQQLLKSDKQILEEVVRNEDRVSFYRQLRAYAKQKKYKVGWAGYQYKEKYKEWPPQSIQASVADGSSTYYGKEVENFLKHLQIKRAKSVTRNYRKAG